MRLWHQGSCGKARTGRSLTERDIRVAARGREHARGRAVRDEVAAVLVAAVGEVVRRGAHGPVVGERGGRI